MEREKSTGIMRVRMLGGFSITYEGAAVVFDRRSPAKFIQLFQLLMLPARPRAAPMASATARPATPWKSWTL